MLVLAIMIVGYLIVVVMGATVEMIINVTDVRLVFNGDSQFPVQEACFHQFVNGIVIDDFKL